jgi:hypothetical protein
MTDNGRDGGQLPKQAIAIGGKGADGLFHYLLTGNDGSLPAATGSATSANQATQITAEQAILATAGATTGAAVITDANGTLQQYLRGIVKLLIGFITVKIDQTTPGLTNGVQPKQYAGVPSSFALLSADGTVFTLAAGEIGFIQNHSADAPLAVKYGASASTTSLSFILKACTAASDGSGGAVRIDNWVGVVSVAKMTGTASYSAWKQAA